jgi:hypothetical protein
MIDVPSFVRIARIASTSVVVVVVLVGAGCFTLVSSGIRREVPEGARAAAQGLTRPHERVVAAWDGSLLQDGSLLVVLGDVGIAKRDGDAVARVELIDVNSIVVNEDDGAVDVITGGGVGLSLPLRSSDERKAFAKLIQTEVQRAKRDSARSREPRAMPEAPVVAPVEAVPVEPVAPAEATPVAEAPTP